MSFTHPHLPSTVATVNAQWANPYTGEITYISVNKGTTAAPEYHWYRNPVYSVVRQFTPSDEVRIAIAMAQAGAAYDRVTEGTFCEMMDNYTALVFVVTEPDPEDNKILGGTYVQRNGNFYKLEHYDEGITLAQIQAVIACTVNSGYVPVVIGAVGSAPPTYLVMESLPAFNNATDLTHQLYSNNTQAEFLWPEPIGYDPVTHLYELVVDGVIVFRGTGNSFLMDPLSYGSHNASIRVVRNDGQIGPLITDVFTTADPGTGTGTGSTGGTTGTGSPVNVGNFGVTIDVNDVTVPNDDYYQIQDSTSYVSIYEGNGVFTQTIPDGTYNIINLDTGERVDNVEIPVPAGGTGTTPPSNPYVGIVGNAPPDYTTGTPTLVDIPNPPGLTYQLASNNTVVEYLWPQPPVYNTELYELVHDGVIVYRGLANSFIINGISTGIHGATIRLVKDDGSFGDPVSLTYDTTIVIPTIGIVGQAPPVYAVTPTLGEPTGFTFTELTSTAGDYTWNAPTGFNPAIELFELAVDGIIVYRGNSTSWGFNPFTQAPHTATVRTVTNGGQISNSVLVDFDATPVGPTVDNTANTIEVPDDGYYQIQYDVTYVEVWQGQGPAVVPVLPNNTYNVINLSTGQRWDGIVVT